MTRAKEEIGRKVEFFITDWAKIWGFGYEAIEKVRVKEASRIHAKARSKRLTEPDELLTRCHEKRGRMRFPIHDLLGVRVLVRSLNDVAGIRRAVDELLTGDHGQLYPLGNPKDFEAEDMNDEPRPDGYRALHIDGSLTVRVEGTDYDVPFEIQIKTLAQHVYGQHTHNEAYVPDDRNEDPRYEDVRGLQLALAETLNGADLLLARIEDVAGAVRDDIARREAGPGLSPASVANTVRELFGKVIRDREAMRWVTQSSKLGITKSATFAALIDPSGDTAADFAEQFRFRVHRGPAYQELIDGLLAGAGSPIFASEGLSQEEQAMETEIERRIDESLPSNELDDMDADADVVVPEQEPKTEAKEN